MDQEWAEAKVSNLFNLEGDGVELLLLEEKIFSLMDEIAFICRVISLRSMAAKETNRRS